MPDDHESTQAYLQQGRKEMAKKYYGLSDSEKQHLLDEMTPEEQRYLQRALRENPA